MKTENKTRSIWHEGCKLHRRAEYHGRYVYIVQFYGVSKAQIEDVDGEREVVEVDDALFKIREYQN